MFHQTDINLICFLGFVKKLNQEPGNKIGLVIVDDFHAPSFNPEKDIFKEQLEKKLAFNVLKKVTNYYFYSLLYTFLRD